MTAPIQEPTLQRKDAMLTWGQNQLFRRPDPMSTTPMAYAWLGSIGNQTDPLPPDDERGFDISPPTDGYSSDISILEPVDTGVAGIKILRSGFIIATARVLTWDNYTGAGNDVINAVKGCSPLWDGGDIAGDVYVTSNDASAASNGANIADFNSLRTDSAIITTASQRVTMQCIQSSAVDAAFGEIHIFAAYFGPEYDIANYITF